MLVAVDREKDHVLIQNVAMASALRAVQHKLACASTSWEELDREGIEDATEGLVDRLSSDQSEHAQVLCHPKLSTYGIHEHAN